MIVLCIQKVKAILLSILLILFSAEIELESKPTPGFTRAVFFSYIDLARMLSQGEETYIIEVETAVENIVSKLDADAVFFHARSHSDALYNSGVYPISSRLVLDTNGAPEFDPLKIFIDSAKARGVAVFAWVNPYRVGENAQMLAGCTSQDAHFMLKCNDSAYLNPTSESARTLVLEGIEELLADYNVAGVIFDDYFYPTADAQFDNIAYAEYLSTGGTHSLAQWRREGVTTLIEKTHALALKYQKHFGVSPAASVARNKDVLFADIEGWLNAGIVDFVCPQIYFGFENTAMPYAQTLEAWQNLCNASDTPLYPALAAYKIGERDGYAGEGALEWTNAFDILARQTNAAMRVADGVAYYRYDSLFNPPERSADAVLAELENIEKNGDDNVFNREKENAQ